MARLGGARARGAAGRQRSPVAAGIDSMVLGESQILGQVRDAMSAATQAGTLNGVLSRLFHCALRGGKRARSLAESGAARILVANRTPERAAALAASIGGQTIPFADIPRVLAEADIVISGTGAGGFILGPELVAPAVAGRHGNELLLLGVACPRRVDPAVRPP